MDKIIESDLYRYGGLTGIKGFLKAWFQPGFRYMFLFRMACRYKKYSFYGIVIRLFKRRYRIKYGFEINPMASIGEGFYLTSHIGPVVIGPVSIGKNCNVAHSVTIGRAYKHNKVGRPTIDDYVWIGTGAVLVGDIRIGNKVLIAPNAYVNFDVPDNSIVIGNPGKIIRKSDPTKHYINFVLKEESE